MCLRMGEDMSATITLFLWILSSSPSFFPLSFPSAGAHESLRPSLHVPFSTPLFFLQPLVCSFGALIQSPASITFSLPPTVRLCYPITLTVQDATRARACAFCLCARMCVFVPFWGTGAKTWHFSNLRPTRDWTQDQSRQRKTKNVINF